MKLNVVSPLFTGPTKDEIALSRRWAAWTKWLQSPGYDALKAACGPPGQGHRVDLYPCGPGQVIGIPTERKPENYPDPENNPNNVRITFPETLFARVPKGLVARLHLLFVMERFHSDDGTADPEVVFACIDGSGAFEFDSIKLLVDSFNSHPTVDVVFGRRPKDNSGMATGRKEIEEFEQYLLFRHRAEELRKSFEGYNFEEPLLPDGQAGCWGFRLRAAPWLPLTATGYEIEYDLLLSALDSGLKAAFTDPLIMSDRPRHSSAGSAPIEMSINKLESIERKLRISREDTAEAWLVVCLTNRIVYMSKVIL